MEETEEASVHGTYLTADAYASMLVSCKPMLHVTAHLQVL